ncbi:RNA ligase 1-like [Glandiceps talaboti]
MPNSVQSKVSCVFKTIVIEGKSSKRQHQQYKVIASKEIKDKAIDAGIETATATEKLDGTCVYVHEFKGKPWLWARFDQKPTKQADKKFKNYQACHLAWEMNGDSDDEPQWQWNVEKDFRTAPGDWIPAEGVPILDGIAQPDDNGHIPGWVPLDENNRQYCWHNSTVQLDNGLAIILRPQCQDSHHFEVTIVPLSMLLEETLELIGSNINANPYGLGCKKNPVHILVPHGAIKVKSPQPLNYDDLKNWLENSDEGKMEGIVWHCRNGELFKFHRHHIGLPWPVEDLLFTSRQITFNVDLSQYEVEFDPKSMFSVLSKFHGRSFQHIRDIEWEGLQ